MKLREGRQFYYDASGAASQIGRQLTLAGIAIIWLISGGLRGGRITLSNTLILSGWMLVLYLLFDLLQYLYKTGAWAIWAWRKEDLLRQASKCPPGNHRALLTWRNRRKVELVKNATTNYEDCEVGETSYRISIPAWILFIFKIAFLLTGYIVLFIDIYARIT